MPRSKGVNYFLITLKHCSSLSTKMYKSKFIFTQCFGMKLVFSVAGQLPLASCTIATRWQTRDWQTGKLASLAQAYQLF